MIGGDSSMRDGKKTAACFLISNGMEQYVEDDRSTMIQAAIKNHINTILSSSMGRLFDAVASILHIKDENGYEGECAVKLEKEAVLALRNNVLPANLAFAVDKEADGIIMDPKPLLEEICKARQCKDKGSLALGFHYAVANAVLDICQIIRMEQNISTVALSGGVFQNTVLTEQVLKILRENNFNVYINRAVPPGDGSISLGQTFIGIMKENKPSSK
jgi:hydrogenase maturation protein HypF